MGLKLVIMLDRHKSIVWVVPQVCGQENHCYCVVNMRENFVAYASKLGIRRIASKDLLKEMFNRVVYAPTAVEYGQASEELRQCKRELARWVEDNELERWAQSKFTKEKWGKLNNNQIKSWNNWMCRLKLMSIRWLISVHLQKLGKKMDIWKAEVGNGRMKLVNG